MPEHTTLGDLALEVRSKNAGPFWTTMELFMRDAAGFEAVSFVDEALIERLAPLRGSERVVFFDMPRLDISSSDIRARVAGGRPIRHLVPDAVAAEIAARGYYRPRAGSPVA